MRCRRLKLKRLLHGISRPRRSLEERRKLFVIYSPGKSGSTSTWLSLAHHYPWANIHHLHRLNPDRWEEGTTQAVRAREALSDLNRIHYQTKVVLVPIRDPISGFVSRIFQNATNHFGHSGPLEADGVCQYLSDNVVDGVEHYMNWMDIEPKRVFGVNLCEHQFDEITRTLVADAADSTIVVYRLEDFRSEELLDFFRRRLNCQDFRFLRVNDGRHKTYASTYESVKQRFKIDKEIFDRFAAMPFMKTFYFDRLHLLRDQWVRE